MPQATPKRVASSADLSHRDATAAWIAVFIGGVVAAMHMWKFPGAMQAIRADVPMTLVQAGVILGMVQVTAMLFGLAFSVVSVRLGMRTTILLGLSLLAAGSFAGALSTETWHLIATRGIEGVGYTLVGIVGPPLIRLWAPADRVNSAMGWWSAFQGIAVFVALIAAMLLLEYTAIITWHGWWVFMGALSLAAIALIARKVPSDGHDAINFALASRKIFATIRTLMPWMMAVVFALYTLQWTAIVGFLPDIVAASGLGLFAAGLATAVVGGLNGVGNVVAGMLLQRGANPRTLVLGAMTSMLVFTTLIFAPDWGAVPGGYWYQLAAAGLFSGISAATPAVILRAAVDVAPPEGTPSAVIGLINQMFSAADFLGPVILTAIATAAGTWRLSWTLTVSASILGIILAATFITPERLQGSRSHSPTA